MSARYVFQRVNEHGHVTGQFHAELHPTQLQHLLHPYQAVLRAAVRLAVAIDMTDTDDVAPQIREQADAFWALVGEYTTEDEA